MHLVLSFGRLNHSTYTDIAEQADIRLLSSIYQCLLSRQ